MGGGPDINYPDQPSYGEGMADALKAQVELLTGTGDFASTGSLESLLPLEESIRRKTAQTDTDILRQTLLGSGSDEKYAPDGRIITGYEDPPADAGGGGGKYKVVGGIDIQRFGFGSNDEFGRKNFGLDIKIIDTTTGKVVDEKKIVPPDPYDNDPVVSKRTAEEARVEFLKSSQYFTPQQAQLYLDADYPEELVFGQGGGVTKAKPIYKKDASGNDVVAPAGSFTPGESTQRAGDGMIDLLGDTRNITQYETKTATQADVDAGLADEVGKQFVQKVDATDQAGFRDGEFKGLSAMAEDIQRGNLSRQREADLQDVARLEPLFGQIMEDYKPGTTSALTGAKDLIEEQKDNLLGEVGISDPTKVQSQGVQADALRAGLMTDAEEALGQGLTDREERQIAEAARARSTMMGRTFDQSGAIAEAEARVAEDNQRKMQNRGFAQSVLGQEAGIQTSDNTRSMQADQFNVASKMDAQKLRESLRQQGLLGYLDAASRVSQLENQGQLDPFQAILGRSGGGSLQAGQSVFGQAGYGLNSGPAYLNPESGLGYIQNQATNAANMYGAQVAADATKTAGIYSGLGALGGGLGGGMIAKYCWVAREVYGEHNPAWKMFRMWMFLESPTWFFKLYKNYGERFANFIADKPRLKAVIRKWMDSKIRR
ncbi:hypothetical protein [uncultured Mediterranean phage uvMED]|nr:hypothetical protein [uncultured Mediterranean phage uvMED]